MEESAIRKGIRKSIRKTSARRAVPARKVAKPAGNDFKRELTLAKKAARVAGEILRGHWRRGGYHIGSKGVDNPVTAADLEADRALKKLLHDPFPEYGWLSEETVDNDARLKCRRVWIVDPLDGTKEFINGIPEFSVAIALVEDGVPILGVTYNPIKREMYWAARMSSECAAGAGHADAQAPGRNRAREPQRDRARRVAGISWDAESQPDRQRCVQARDGCGGQRRRDVYPLTEK